MSNGKEIRNDARGERTPYGDGKQQEARCQHRNLMRHDYHGETWWQCEEGCDFLFRSQLSHASGEVQQAYRESAAAYAEIGPGKTPPVGTGERSE